MSPHNLSVNMLITSHKCSFKYCFTHSHTDRHWQQQRQVLASASASSHKLTFKLHSIIIEGDDDTSLFLGYCKPFCPHHCNRSTEYRLNWTNSTAGSSRQSLELSRDACRCGNEVRSTTGAVVQQIVAVFQGSQSLSGSTDTFI